MEKQQLASKQQMTSANDIRKWISCWSWELRSLKWRFPSPSAIFDGANLKLRPDGFLERFLLFCPFPKKIMYEEVTSASDSLRSNDSSDAQSFKKLLEQISNYHVFMFRQYRYFFTCLFTGAFGKLVRGSFFYDHYIQVVIKRKKGITVVVKSCKRIWGGVHLYSMIFRSPCREMFTL